MRHLTLFFIFIFLVPTHLGYNDVAIFREDNAAQEPQKPPPPPPPPGPISPDPGGPPNTSGTTGTTTGTTSMTTGNTTTDTTGTSSSYNNMTSCSSCLPRTDYEEPRVHRRHRIRGEVRHIDPKHYLLSMRSKDTTRPYKITRKTAFAPKGTSLETIHVGDHVSITYIFSHRRRIAVRITILEEKSK